MTPLRTLIAPLCLLALAAAARAECTGTDITDGWTEAERAEVAAAAAAHPYPAGRFWEVEKDGATSVLFGTIHLTDPVLAEPPEPLLDRLEEADLLLLEVTAQEEKRMQRAMLLNPGLVLAEDGKRLRPTFSEAEWAELDRVVRPFGLTAEVADQLSPWFLTLMLATPPCILNAVPTEILDRRIERAAEAAGVEVRGLETYEDLFRMLGQGSHAEQAEMLRLSLPTLTRSEDLLETTKQLYLKGEIMMIWEAGVHMMREDELGAEGQRLLDQSMDMLLGDRNRAWMETLVPALEKGDVVVAVGALHLGGTDGLLRLLEDEGFAIRRLDG